MKIYEVTGYDSAGTTWYFEPTIKAARTRIRAMRAEGPWDNIELKPVVIEPTRAGVASMLNHLIHVLCVNEH